MLFSYFDGLFCFHDAVFVVLYVIQKIEFIYISSSKHSYFNRWFGDSMKVQYNSLTMLLSSFMQEFGPISSRVYCIFAQITNNKFVVELSIRNLNKCSI